MDIRCALSLAALIAIEGCRPPAPTRGAPSPEADPAAPRAELFANIMEKTARREAWSPIKNERLGLDWTAAARAIRPEIVNADSDRALFFALVKLSNARKDRHLKVRPIADGLDVPEASTEVRIAPIQFLTDYSQPGAPFFFVADVARDLAEPPTLGDRVVAVDGVPVEDWVEQQTPWVRYSTVDNLWWQLAAHLHRDRRGEGPPLGSDSLHVELQRRSGERYPVTVPFRAPDTVEWAGHATPKYTGFAVARATESGTLYAPTDGRKLALIQWHGFRPTLQADLDAIMQEVERRGLLGHDLIVDVTHAGGGAGSAWAVQRFSSRRFKGTFGNIRLSDVLPDFIELVRRDDWDEPREHGVLEWLEGDVTRQAADGRQYSDDVPFKLFHLPKDSDGWFDPAPLHFEGRLACIFGPRGGSNLDQFGSMVVDNGLGYTIGLPLGGYSNTWEWTETLTMPDSGRPLVSYMWSIGHTLRPNGDILEGNPAVPETRFALTAGNFRSYHDQAIARIVAHWSE